MDIFDLAIRFLRSLSSDYYVISALQMGEHLKVI